MIFVDLRKKPGNHDSKKSCSCTYNQIIDGSNPNRESQISRRSCFEETRVDLNITYNRS